MTYLSLLTPPPQRKVMPDSVPSHFLPPLQHSSAIVMAHQRVPWHPMADRLGVGMQIKRNRSPRSERISSGRKPALRTIVAWIPGHNRRTTLSSFPKASVCCPIWSTPLGIEDNRVVGLDPPKRPTSSAGQTPPRDSGSHVQSCARSGSLGF